DGGPREQRTLDAFSTRLRASSAGFASFRRFVAMPSADEMQLAVNQTAESAPYVFLGPFRWNEFDTNTAIPFDTQSGGQSGLAGGGASELSRAQSIWSTPTGLRFSAGGSATLCEATANQNRGHIGI